MPTEINGYSPSQETPLSSLIINEVDSNETFEKMKNKGLLQDNQLYLVTDGGTDTITPEDKPYLTFNSPNSFTLAVGDATKHWDGTLEYSTDETTWSTWDGTTTLSAVDNDGEYVLYLRGTGNTRFAAYDADNNYIPWVISGTDVRCNGNIETLLDYATVEAGQHPTMEFACYMSMFSGCTALTQAPTLPATTLTIACYAGMFSGCTSLTQAPALPATTLADMCYSGMFAGCTSLTQAPALPVITLVPSCYSGMFNGCTSLTQAPALPATTLAESCYSNMFQGCTSLTQAPALPATTLAKYCYQNMFRECTALTQAPALPATTLASDCYNSMFNGCTSLTQAPALPATTLTDYCYCDMFWDCISLAQAPALPATTLAPNCYQAMFVNCASLTQAPALPATTLASNCYQNMFQDCTSLTQAPNLPATTLASNCYFSMFNGCTSLTKVPALPATTLATSCYQSMFRRCTSIKLSATQTGEYTQEYRVPSSGTGTTAKNALTDMFTSTGGTFTGTPSIDTIYYLGSDNMIVRETEVATLREYVGSMIDANSDVFIATYETTTSAEIEEAYQAGKAIYCIKSGDLKIGVYGAHTSSSVHAFSVVTAAAHITWLCQNDTWSTVNNQYTPKSHASTHGSSGSDPISPTDIGAAPSNHTHTSLALTDLTVNGSTRMNSEAPLSLTSNGIEYGAISVNTSNLPVGNDNQGNIYTGDANKLIIRGPSTLCIVGNPENNVALYVDRHRIAFVGDPICTYDATNKQYVDQKISEIPTPDVRGQIDTHNRDSAAHSDIRRSITMHSGDTSIHVTANQKAAWDAKATTTYVDNAIQAAIGRAIGGSY